MHNGIAVAALVPGQWTGVLDGHRSVHDAVAGLAFDGVAPADVRTDSARKSSGELRVRNGTGSAGSPPGSCAKRRRTELWPAGTRPRTTATGRESSERWRLPARTIAASPCLLDRPRGGIDGARELTRAVECRHPVHPVAAGIVEVTAPSDGGVKLSPEGNVRVPAALRPPSGCYEKDCEWGIAAATFLDEFMAARNLDGSGGGHVRRLGILAACCRRMLIDCFPEGYRKITGAHRPRPVARA